MSSSQVTRVDPGRRVAELEAFANKFQVKDSSSDEIAQKISKVRHIISHTATHTVSSGIKGMGIQDLPQNGYNSCTCVRS